MKFGFDTMNRSDESWFFFFKCDENNILFGLSCNEFGKNNVLFGLSCIEFGKNNV